MKKEKNRILFNLFIFLYIIASSTRKLPYVKYSDIFDSQPNNNVLG
jgi:hypothetical protein